MGYWVAPKGMARISRHSNCIFFCLYILAWMLLSSKVFHHYFGSMVPPHHPFQNTWISDVCQNTLVHVGWTYTEYFIQVKQTHTHILLHSLPAYEINSDMLPCFPDLLDSWWGIPEHIIVSRVLPHVQMVRIQSVQNKNQMSIKYMNGWRLSFANWEIRALKIQSLFRTTEIVRADWLEE